MPEQRDVVRLQMSSQGPWYGLVLVAEGALGTLGVLGFVCWVLL